ncbi:lysozyme inhibitor LprI family protein [Luteimonas sp. A537]
MLAPSTANAEEVIRNCNGVTNQEIFECIESRYKISDSQLNAVYQKKLSTISAKHRKQFIETQRTWIPFKERHCDIVYESTSPGQEAPIEKYICLWKATDDRVREINRIGGGTINDEFYNFILSLQTLGFSQSEMISKLRDRYINEEGGWQDYAAQNCRFTELISSENFEICMARLAAQRGSN